MGYCKLEGKSIEEEMPSPCRNGCIEYLCSCMPVIVKGAWIFGECMEQSYCGWCSFSNECGLD